MEEMISKVPDWIQGIALALSGLMVFATALVRIPGLKKHQGKVGKVKAFIDKVILWLPTIGINPKTKELQKKVDEKK